MKKKKNHKWKYRINVKKKILVLVILGVLLFVGMGYAIVNSNLGIGGTLEVSKYDKTLYGALKKEVKNGYALKYAGAHQDSMDSSKSTEDIYHFYADTAQKGTDILNRNNVVFANHCWQMIRTTDTGGVKLLYNGEPEITEVNGQTQYNCGDTRNLYHLGTVKSTVYLSGPKKYAKNYTASASGTTTTFTLVDDPEDPDDTYTVNITSSNAATEIAYIKENYPYTCANATGTCTNKNFYKVIDQYDDRTANAYKSTYRDGIGESYFNPQYTSPAYAGYMYGDVYTVGSYAGKSTQMVAKSQQMLYMDYFNSTYKYSKTLNSVQTSYVYELYNPVLGSSIQNQDYTGYYTYRSSSTVSGPEPNYIVGRSQPGGSSYYYARLSPTRDLASYNIMVGTDLVDNGDNTYTIKNGTNQATLVIVSDWFSNYANYAGMYTCGDTTDTCANPRYITRTTPQYYTYIQDMETKFTIAKTRNGLDISDDYVTISYMDWYNGYNTTYADYVYTCGNTDTVCTESNLRYITGRTAENYTYALNYYFGASVKYENGKYVLQNVEPLEAVADSTTLSTHHYTCLNPGETECNSVVYIYSRISNSWGYITLNDPSITSVQDALDAMFTKNTTDSTIKTNVDAWYEENLLNTTFESKLDDTIYCNDRSYSTEPGVTFNDSGFNANGGQGQANLALAFKGHTFTNDLSCTNVTDRFSVSNNVAPLTYKIGLISFPELSLLNQSNIWKASNAYWMLSPKSFNSNQVLIRYVRTNGEINGQVSDSGGIIARPAISLISGTKYSRGNGSMTDPYVVDMGE